MPQCITVDCHAARLMRLKQSTLTSARLLQAEAEREGRGFWCAFVTLTLKDGDSFRKGMISEFLHRAKSWYAKRGVKFRYVWVGELQKRGVLHYHAVFWLPKGLMLPKPDKRGWWPWGSSSIERARHVIGYLAKYVSKGTGGREVFPKACRIHGSGGLSATAADERRWWLCPSWVRELLKVEDRPFRNVGGGFVARGSGELVPSPYRVIGIANGFVRLVRVDHVPT